MVCYKPLKAYRALSPDPETGKRGLTFNPVKALIEGTTIALPCGQCIGCRIAKTKMWAVRCMHEAQLYEQNCFITLTYSDDKLPKNYSVSVREWQLFMKRLRKKLNGRKIRSFACGEYGPKDLRPHYHALLFNYDFPDRQRWKVINGKQHYRSKILESIWTDGFSSLSDLNYTTAGYVARYCMKKLNGDMAKSHYTRKHPVTGEIHQVTPEFATQSRRPGLGAEWIKRFKSDVFPHDYIIVDGHKAHVPKFYELQLTEEELNEVKRARKIAQVKDRSNNTPERLKVREYILEQKLKLLKRNGTENDAS